MTWRDTAGSAYGLVVAVETIKALGRVSNKNWSGPVWLTK
jgi:hypothetical protein